MSNVKLERIKKRNDRMKARNRVFNGLPPETEDKSIKPDILHNKDLTIEICIHCYNYQHRLCWMLSSILQQEGEIPNIVIDISHSENQGSPTTESVCNFFREQGLNINETMMTEKEVSNRAIARNRQVKGTEADFMLFADSDLVYDPYFFEDLANQLRTNLKDVTLVMGADRHSLSDQFCIKYFEEDKREYPCIVKNVAKISSDFPVKWISGRRIAPGFFQLASVESINDHGGIYCGRQRDHWRGTRSDRGFRCHLGGRVSINTKPQYHLNHDRGGPEIQR